MATPGYGYSGYYKPPKAQTLSQAAAGKDPYGLRPDDRGGPRGANPLGLGSGRGFATSTPTPKVPVGQPAPAGAAPTAQAISTVLGQIAQGQQGAPTAAAVNKYDLSTDPALQQIQALVGMSDQQANAEAMKERQQLLLQYGDPSVAASLLGANDPTVAAAKGNPTSTVAQLGQQRDRNLTDLTEGLNKSNLIYSGYRVNQEQQAGQDFQNALAQAAAGLNSSLSGVDSNLTGALAQNRAQEAQGITDAANRAAQAAAASGIDPGAIAPNAIAPNAIAAGTSDPSTLASAAAGGQGDAKGASYVDPVTQSIIDAGLKRRQDFLNFGLRSSF